MRMFGLLIIAIVVGIASASAEPVGVRVNPHVILEPISAVPLSEAFHYVEFVNGDEAVVGVWRFGHEDAAIDGGWQAIGLLGISALGEGIEPVFVRVWVDGYVNSGDSADLRVTRIAPPPNTISAFSVQMTRTRGIAMVTLGGDGRVRVEGQALGVTGP